MFAIKQSREPINEEANRFLFELEQEFDLKRLRSRRELLEQEEVRLAERQESLSNDLRLPAGSPDWPYGVPAEEGWMRKSWRAVATKVAIWRLEIRQQSLAEEMRRLVLLEEEIEFVLRLRRRPSRG